LQPVATHLITGDANGRDMRCPSSTFFNKETKEIQREAKTFKTSY